MQGHKDLPHPYLHPCKTVTSVLSNHIPVHILIGRIGQVFPDIQVQPASPGDRADCTGLPGRIRGENTDCTKPAGEDIVCQALVKVFRYRFFEVL